MAKPFRHSIEIGNIKFDLKCSSFTADITWRRHPDTQGDQIGFDRIGEKLRQLKYPPSIRDCQPSLNPAQIVPLLSRIQHQNARDADIESPGEFNAGKVKHIGDRSG